MNYWIRAYNHKRFRVADFIRDYGFIDWEMRNRYEVGDIVFLYATAPESRLTFMLEVTRVEMDFKNTADDGAYYISQQYYEQWMACGRHRKYVRYEFLKSLDSPALKLEFLREHGLSGAPRSPRRMCPELADYVMSHLR